MRELEPGAREGIAEGLRVFEEAARDRSVLRVHPQGEVARQHARFAALRRIVGEGNHVGPAAVDRTPLVSATGALHELPVVREQDVEELVVPASRVVRPRHLEARRDRVVALARAEGVLPAEALVLEARGLGVVLNVRVGGRAVRLAERVSAGDERDGLFVVHSHAPEGLADVAGRGERVRIAVGTLRVDVDQPHLHGRERLLELAVTLVALVGEPRGLGTPVHVVVRLPHVGTPAAETEGFEAHGLERDVTGENHQVQPARGSARTSSSRATAGAEPCRG